MGKQVAMCCELHALPRPHPTQQFHQRIRQCVGRMIFFILGRIAAVAAELHITALCDDSTNAQSLSRHTSRKSKKRKK